VHSIQVIGLPPPGYLLTLLITWDLLHSTPQRFFSDDVFSKKEHAAERDFINRTERELLKKIVQKYENLDPEEAAQISGKLESLLKKHKITPTPALLADLKKWRQGEYNE